jgi:hypothetical protein
MASQVITYKRASTFGATCTYTPESGGPANLDGLTITSDIRDANNRIYSCTVTVTSPTTFTVFYGDTAGWALGSAYWDIRFTNNGIIFFSDTVILNVINNVTVE